MADPLRLTLTDQCVVNAVGWLMAGYGRVDDILHFIAPDLPKANSLHPYVGPLVDGLSALAAIEGQRLDPVTAGQRRRHAYDQLRRACDRFYGWRLGQSLAALHPAAAAEEELVE